MGESSEGLRVKTLPPESSSDGDGNSPEYSWDYDDTTTIFSPYGSSSEFSSCDNKGRASKTVRGVGRVGGEGVAAEKDSNDPFLDIRHSLLQMILENKIYVADDFRKLLRCFLLLNSPYHHGLLSELSSTNFL
ncbi:transcription repressor OFP8-like [Prosopis cineraria]|uniref:transcription repressor OFP8-like n=1 Tax=Prosopis cineraria TaxID=364024 RepID=UPI002410A9B4|nr:transcription repressor OFP8-like [Prosopis cineraria]